MNFTQGTRGIVRAIAVVLSVAVPLAIAISAADARVGGGSELRLAGIADLFGAPEHAPRRRARRSP